MTLPTLTMGLVFSRGEDRQRGFLLRAFFTFGGDKGQVELQGLYPGDPPVLCPFSALRCRRSSALGSAFVKWASDH